MSNEQDILQTLGKKIQELREAKGISQMDLAYEAGTGMSYLSKIENGHHMPGVLLLIRMAKVLEVKPSELISPLDRFAE